MAYETMAAADFAFASAVYSQTAEATVASQGSEQWVILGGTQDHVMTIAPALPTAPVAWRPVNDIGAGRVPLGFRLPGALRLKALLNNLPG